MSKTTLFTAAALLGTIASGAALANCSSAPPLYAQDPASTGHAASGGAFISQNFETAYDSYDSEAADDFMVPAGGWIISEVDVDGFYAGSGPATSETVTIYTNIGGLPATQVTSVTVAGTDTGGSFCIPVAITLPHGHFWLSVVANMSAFPNGEWEWNLLAPPRILKAAAWRNPGGGFAFPPQCQSWVQEHVCVPVTGRDHIFTLR